MGTTIMATNRVSFPIVGGYGVERSAVLGSERTLNMYVTDMPSSHFGNPSKNKGLVKWPGFIESKVIAGGTAAGRAFFQNKVDPSVAYIVKGNKLYEIDVNLDATELGTIGTTSGHIGIDQNQTQLIIVDGTGGWTYNFITATFAAISDPQFTAITNPVDVVSIDGYAIVADGDTNQFHFSTVNDFTSWPGASAGITSRPDKITAVSTINRNLIAFGSQSTEMWYDAGVASFTNSVPFRRFNNILPPYGCASRDSVAEGFGLMFFLGKEVDGVSAVIRVSGNSFQRISTPSIEYAFEGISNLSDARGDLYQIDGELFYQLSFTSGNKTFVYHVNQNLWYELANSSGGRHAAQAMEYFNGKHYFVGYDNGTIYEMNSSYLDNDGEAMLCERITTKLSSQKGNAVRLDRVNLTFSQGVGNYNATPKYNSNNAYNPHVFLAVSRDEGRDFDHEEKQEIGKSGETTLRTLFQKPYGESYSYVFRIRFYARTNYILTGMFIDVIEGNM